jgi:hypothetical protein
MMKHFTLIAAGLIATASLSAQSRAEGTGTFSGSSKTVSVAEQLAEKNPINIGPASYADTACQQVALWTFNVQGQPAGFIFGYNAFLDNQKGYRFNGTGSVMAAGAFIGFKVHGDSIPANQTGDYYAHVFTADGMGGWTLAGSSIATPYAAIDTSLAQGPQATPFVFSPAIDVAGDFIVMIDVFEQTDSLSGIAIWANGPSCGTDLSYERYLGQNGYVIDKMSAAWNGPGGAGLLADPYMGILFNVTSGVETLTPSSLMAYPNPAADQTTLSFGINQDVMGMVEVRNLAGQLVMNVQQQFYTGKNNVVLNLNGLSNGIYSYTVIAGDVVMPGKLVVTH